MMADDITVYFPIEYAGKNVVASIHSVTKNANGIRIDDDSIEKSYIIPEDGVCKLKGIDFMLPPGTFILRNELGNDVELTIFEMSVQSGTYTQSYNRVLKDENGSIVSVEEKTVSQSGNNLSCTRVTKDANGNVFSIIEETYSYTVDGKPTVLYDNLYFEKTYALTVTVNGSIELPEGCKVVINDLIPHTTDGTFYLSEGTYNVELKVSNSTIGIQTITLDKNKEVNFNLYKLTFKVQEPDGTPVAGEYVSLNIGNRVTTDENGAATFYVTDGTYKLSSSKYWDEQEIEVTGNTPTLLVPLTIPKLIKFDVLINGEANSVNVYNLDRTYTDVKSDGNKGSYSGRLDPNKEYLVAYHSERTENDYVEGSIRITDGMTVRIGKLTVQTDGAGLAFPFAPFGTSSSYNVFVGNPVRLAAVPVGDSKFQCWSINGEDYTDALMDFKVKDDITVATAKFTEKVATRIKSMDSNVKPINVTIEGNYLVLPAEVKASAVIYAVDGRQVKRTGVVGDLINISDLPAGAYVLTLTADGLRQSAQFVK